jgi:RES domain-containing protein
MGRAKREWMEAEERGWSSPEGYVCENCVEDDFLKGLVQQNLASKTCSFCGKKSRKFVAAPLEALMPAIAGAVGHFYSDPTHAGVPWDEGSLDEGECTLSMLDGLPLEGNDKFITAVANALHNQMWVRAAGGMWMASHESEVLSDSWQHFVHTVKHRTRFHFHLDCSDDRLGTSAESPGFLLAKLGELVHRAGLLKSIEQGASLFRVRVRNDDSWAASEHEMGPPPISKATSGRMNPAGIRYLYTALEDSTALAEALGSPPQEVVLATFSVARSLTVVDLCNMPPVPSIFDVARLHLHDGLRFLHEFVREISKPVSKHSDERIEYVPTQVVCEWFAQVFEPRGEGSRVDGLMYPSAVRPGGRNLVLFPRRDGWQWVFDGVKYRSASELSLKTWADVFTRVE